MTELDEAKKRKADGKDDALESRHLNFNHDSALGT